MLCVPALAETDGLTIYADDTEFWRFYPIPTEPRIREQDGEPVLLLISYAVSDQDRAAHPELPPGGGYLSLDTVLAPLPEQLNRAAKTLQHDVDQRWEQLRNGTPEEQARLGVAGTVAAPRVVFGTPTFTNGAVKLDAPQSERLVSSRLAAGTPTLLPGNVATFNLDLTPDGAQFIAMSLGADEEGPAPLQVAYDLSFWARLPPARIHMAIDASKMHEYIRKQLEGRGIDNCTTYDYDHSDVTQESMTLSGAVTVQIDTGSGSFPDEVISELRGYAFDTLKQLVQSTFFQPVPASPPPAPGGIRVPFFRDTTLLVKSLDQQTMNVTLDLEQSSVVEWKIYPKATLTGVVGSDEASRKRHIRKLALDDPFFSDINVAVEVFTEYALVDHVEVELSHEGTTGDGQPRHESTVFTFHEPGAQVWSIRRFSDAGTYDIRHRVVFPGGKTGEWSRWERKDSARVAISVESPGVVHATAAVGNVDFDALVASAQVTFAYADVAHSVPEERSVVVLTRDMQTQEYTRAIGVPVSGTLKFKVRFDLLTGDVIEDEGWSEVIGQQVVVNQPAESVLRVNLLPAGNAWSTLVAVFVTLEYSDAEGNVMTGTYEMRTIDEFRTWQVYLRDRTRRGYRYRWTASFLDGTTTTKDWTDNPGDPVLSITLNRTGVDVLVVPDAVDFAVCSLVEVTLRSMDPVATTTMVFRDHVPQVWKLEGARAEDLAITVDITQFPTGQPPLHLPQRIENDSVVALPAVQHRVSIRVVNVVGTLVDYGVTPIVGIDIEAGDGPSVTAALTINVDAPSAFFEFSPEDDIPSYRYRITYFDKIGRPTESAWQTTNVARIVVPAFTA